MQWIAVITMIIDHIGIVWFPDSPVWRIVGRMAMPIYTYFIALGMSRTRSVPKYMLRLTALALLSQIPFTLLFHTWTVNVIGTFAVSVCGLYLMERLPASNPLRYAPPVAAALILEADVWLGWESAAFDYGAYGLLLLVIYRYMKSHMTVFSHFALNVLYISTPLQLFSILPTLFFVYGGSGSGASGRAMPRWLWRSFYPGHLALLYVLTFILARA